MDTKERQFALPVDSEHKALKVQLFSVALPHMRAFHLCWFGFFTSFVSTFAPAAMIPVVREDLGLSKADLGNAGARFLADVLLPGCFGTALARYTIARTTCIVHVCEESLVRMIIFQWTLVHSFTAWLHYRLPVRRGCHLSVQCSVASGTCSHVGCRGVA